jgi:hypothetical protein
MIGDVLQSAKRLHELPGTKQALPASLNVHCADDSFLTPGAGNP